MDPIHIHNLLRQLSNEVRCPHCSAKVRPDMITVENLSQNFCFLNINCYSCGEVFHGHAHVGVKVTTSENTPGSTPSSEEGGLPPSPPIISEADIDHVRASLQTPHTISDLFPLRNGPKIC